MAAIKRGASRLIPQLSGLILVLFLLCPTAVHAQGRQALRARHGMVVSASPHASDVGLEILKKGGNAVDAAIVVGFALAVVHPSAGNIGGGGFMLVHHARTGQEATVDFRETAPSAARRNMYQDPQGKVLMDLSTVGYLASGVPGSVAGLHLAWKKFGSLPWGDLIEPAIRLAGEGFPVSDALSRSLKAHRELLSRFQESRRIFLRDHRLYNEGEKFRQPELARTLRLIAREGPKAFYEGEIAKMIVDQMKKNGGNITRDDLRNYEAKVRPPIRGTYRGYQVVSIGPPSSGGIVLLEMLNMMELHPSASLGFHSSRGVHLLVEIMRRAFADRAAFLGDADFAAVPVNRLISKSYARRRVRDIDVARASSSFSVGRGEKNIFESSETTHYSIIDREGNAVATTTTINGSYGSGVTIEGAGFLMNNEMDDFSSKPGVPNQYGLIQGEANAIAPRKRPLSAMTPTIVKKDQKVFLVLGSPGGPAIINTVFQILLNVMDHGFTIQEAVDAPRVHHQWFPDRIRVERRALGGDVRQSLQERGHKMECVETIGDAHSILIDSESGIRLGAPDPRSDSKAAGY